jgi:hypothetical protein
MLYRDVVRGREVHADGASVLDPPCQFTVRALSLALVN